MQKGTDLVVITGATGNQGGAVARELLARGHRVRAVTRRPEKAGARALAAAGAQVVQGDLDDAASLERALKGAWGLFAVQNTWEAGAEREEEQGKRTAEIAKLVGVQHFVYSSVGSAHRQTGIPHFDNKWRVEERVRELKFPSHVIIRPVFFMENFLSPWFKPGIDSGTLSAGIRPDTKLQMIAVDDIGKYGALAFEDHARLNRREIDIAGDELTMPQVADVLSKILGRTVVFEQTPIEQVRQFSADYALMLEWFDRVGYDVDIRKTAEEYVVPPTPFGMWAARMDWK